MMKIKYKYVLRQIARNWIVFFLEQGEENSSNILSLNESGALLWQRLEKGSSVEELAQALVDEYALPVQQAQKDAVEFLGKLRAAGCIEE